MHSAMSGFGSLSWAGKAAKPISDFADNMGYTQPAHAVEMKQGFNPAAAESCRTLGKALGEAIKAQG